MRADPVPFTGGVGMYDGFVPPGADPQFIFTDPAEFAKAVTAGYGTDVAGLTGGAALRLQSLEQTLIRSIQTDEHFRLFNLIAQSNAGATVDEFSVKPYIGGFPGSAFNSELGDIPQTQGQYQRKTISIKYLMTQRQVSVVQTSQKTLVDTIAEEKIDATRELKTSIEWGMFYGDSAVNPLEFDGLLAAIRTQADADLIKDVRGGGLSYVAKEILDVAAAISQYGRFGRATHVFCSSFVKTSELDQKLDPAFRVVAGRAGEVKPGTPVTGINGDNGDLSVVKDVFIREGQVPWEVGTGTLPAIVTAAGLTVPVIASATPSADAASQFATAHAGLYYYGVESVGQLGRSTAVVSSQVTVAAGDKVTVTITNPADANVTGYAIYRGRRNGTNAKGDLREVIRIARTGGASTVWVDYNADIPGTSQLFVLSMAPGDLAVTLRRLLPMTMFPLFPVSKAVKPWAQLFFCALRVAKPQQIGMVKNIVPEAQTWKPF